MFLIMVKKKSYVISNYLAKLYSFSEVIPKIEKTTIPTVKTKPVMKLNGTPRVSGIPMVIKYEKDTLSCHVRKSEKSLVEWHKFRKENDSYLEDMLHSISMDYCDDEASTVYLHGVLGGKGISNNGLSKLPVRCYILAACIQKPNGDVRELDISDWGFLCTNIRNIHDYTKYSVYLDLNKVKSGIKQVKSLIESNANHCPICMNYPGYSSETTGNGIVWTCIRRNVRYQFETTSIEDLNLK